MAAPLLSKYLYGKESKGLTADEKSTISAIIGLVTSGVGATTSDIGSTVQSGQVAQNAVENNYLTISQIKKFDNELGACKNDRCKQAILKKIEDISIEQDKELAAVCSVNAALCKEKYGFIVEYRNGIKRALGDTKNLPAPYESGLFSQQIEAEGFVFNVELARQFKTKYNISDEDATLIAMAVSGVGIAKAVKSKNTVNSKYPVSEATKAENGLVYKSNSKHTLGGEGNRSNAGIEPKNSLELFNNSVPIGGNSNKRYTIDSKGNIHQFTYEGSGSNTYHWAGGTGDSRNPLKLDNKTKLFYVKMVGNQRH